jgi:hypothetical protein
MVRSLTGRQQGDQKPALDWGLGGELRNGVGAAVAGKIYRTWRSILESSGKEKTNALFRAG